MPDQIEWVWMNGRVVPWQNANVHVSSYGFRYGTGVFEGIRCYDTVNGPTLFRLDEHLDRFFTSATAYDLQIAFTRKELIQAICKIIQRNRFRSCYVSAICYYSGADVGLVPVHCPVHLNIVAWPWGMYLGRATLERGVRLTVSPWRNFHSAMIPAAAKACGQYVNSVLAIREAISRGYYEALLLDDSGCICEGSGENVFLIKNKQLFTSDVRHSILPGITRDAVITLARDLGIQVEARPISLQELLSADEAFLTGTAVQVTPICEINGKVIGAGMRGPVTQLLQQRFLAVVSGSEPAYRRWLYVVHLHRGVPLDHSRVAEEAD